VYPLLSVSHVLSWPGSGSLELPDSHFNSIATDVSAQPEFPIVSVVDVPKWLLDHLESRWL
jgi:hypothetical protein